MKLSKEDCLEIVSKVESLLKVTISSGRVVISQIIVRLKKLPVSARQLMVNYRRMKEEKIARLKLVGLEKESGMGMKRCLNGHFFDTAKDLDCPVCKVAESASASTISQLSASSVQSNPAPIDGAQTVAMMVKQTGIDPVVGWLVCVNGPDTGKDFKIRAERNFIGRSPEMQVCLADPAVSRDSHAVLSFDPRKKTFKLSTGSGRGLIYVNGEELLTTNDLSRGDRIEIGSSVLLFVPFHGEFYDWETKEVLKRRREKKPGSEKDGRD